MTSKAQPFSDISSLVQCGPTYRLGETLGLAEPRILRRLFKVLLLLSLTWLPLVVLSAMAGHAYAGVAIPFFGDPESNIRLLVALPLLEFATGIVGVSLVVQACSFLEMDLVSAARYSQFRVAHAAAVRLRESVVAEGVLLVLAYGASLRLRIGLGLGSVDSSWERVGVLTAAGWWHTLVSLPLLYFLLLRWAWVFVLWAWFLVRVSRLDLELTPTHPDRVGGLGFLAWGVASFAPLLMAMSAMISAGLADEIFHHGKVFADLKYDIGAYVCVALLVLYALLLSFVPSLSRCRFRRLLQFGKLVLDHDRAFETKWLQGEGRQGKDLLGSADLQTLADAGTCYEHIDEMRLFPFDVRAFAVLALAAVLPFAALLGSSIKELVLRLGELLI